MNKYSVALLTCCLALSANFAFSGDRMHMEKSASGDAMMHKDTMPSHSMKKNTMDKGMKMEHGKKHTMKQRKSKRAMHKNGMEHKKHAGTMQRMQ